MQRHYMQTMENVYIYAMYIMVRRSRTEPKERCARLLTIFPTPKSMLWCVFLHHDERLLSLRADYASARGQFRK